MPGSNGTGSNGKREDGAPSRDFLAGQLSVLYAIEELSMRGEARVPIAIHRVVMPMNPRETDPYSPELIQTETVHAVPVSGLYENIMRKLGELGAYSYVDSYSEHALRMALLHLRDSKGICDPCRQELDRLQRDTNFISAMNALGSRDWRKPRA